MVNFLHLLYEVINWAFWAYSLLIVINSIMSWAPFLYNSKLGQMIARVVEPFLNIFRIGPLERLTAFTGLDISPIIALFILYFIQRLFSDLLLRLILRY